VRFMYKSGGAESVARLEQDKAVGRGFGSKPRPSRGRWLSCSYGVARRSNQLQVRPHFPPPPESEVEEAIHQWFSEFVTQYWSSMYYNSRDI
jgi:hypothetical protein